MGGREGRLFLSLLLCGIVLFFFSGAASAADEKSYFELGIGGGINLNSIDSIQALLAPAYSIPIKGADFLRFRIEGDVEIIEYHGRFTAITGIAPFIRAEWKRWKWRPFAEIGGGGNYTTRNKLDGKNLRGPFLFSAMGGAGVEFSWGGRPVSISYRLRHLSNGHMYRENQGINSQYLMLSVGF